MLSFHTSLQTPLRRRLTPLAYALVFIVAGILLMTWGALKIQVTLAGFLNSESLWSKAQKQAIIALDGYAATGSASQLADFNDNYGLMTSDRHARDAIASGHFDPADISRAFVRGNVMPSAKSGMIFMLEYFPTSPHVKQALQAWRSTDSSIAELGKIAASLQSDYSHGALSAQRIRMQRARIQQVNQTVAPYTRQFSLEIARGAVWLGRMLFYIVLAAGLLAIALWLLMARRILSNFRGTEERYSLLFDSAADAIVIVDEKSGRILDANKIAISWTGRLLREMVGKPFSSLFKLPAPVESSRAAANFLLAVDGSMRPVETHGSMVIWEQRPVRQAIIRDISERVAMEQERQVAAEALASIAEGVIIADASRRVVSINSAHTRITGFSLADMQGRLLDELRSLPSGEPLPPSIWATVAAGASWQGEVRAAHAGGETYPEQLSLSAIRDADAKVLYYVAVFTNIHSTKVNQHRLEHLARHDPLTGLVNRAEFERRCGEAIARAQRERKVAAVLFIDLDAFKIINDSYSHAIGDRLLVAVAERIQAQLSDGDVAGRIGGDEFTVLLHRLSLREDARAVAMRLLAVLSEPVLLDDYEIIPSASIGVAGFPLDGSDTLALIANADAAMYAAKTEERNAMRFYTPLMHAGARRRLQLAAELRQALVRDEFHLVYQPSVELRSGRIVAVEALLRWQHPERGEVLPGEFIPVAESLGMIRQIDEWVLQNACQQIQRWDRAGMPAIRVAINISARWFGHSAFVEGVSRTLHTLGLPSRRLLLEITESAMLSLGEDTERTMRILHTLGIDVAIDDFGTGYSSMAYLKLPAVAYLKIDRSFVTGLPESTNDAAITEGMLAMSKSLGLRTIAEGIETEAQHEFLLRAGCMEGQGYLYSYPLDPEGIERLLKPNQAQALPVRLRLVPPRRS